MASAVCSVVFDCCYLMVLFAVRMVQSTYQAYYNSVPIICWVFVFLPCQVQRWCHHLADIEFWRSNEVFYIGEYYSD